ncbi:unnamed protein product [Parnassius mnemosyne]|uniref:DDE Tnp4 domain-containing protein n=1 Tax=Parnassius mnemosyne TaxID=213953 RepID=A0AAV1LCI9_9NEOP
MAGDLNRLCDQIQRWLLEDNEEDDISSDSEEGGEFAEQSGLLGSPHHSDTEQDGEEDEEEDEDVPLLALASYQSRNGTKWSKIAPPTSRTRSHIILLRPSGSLAKMFRHVTAAEKENSEMAVGRKYLGVTLEKVIDGRMGMAVKKLMDDNLGIAVEKDMDGRMGMAVKKLMDDNFGMAVEKYMDSMDGDGCEEDSAFSLTENMMKPYAGTHNKGSKERVFNYRLSRARRIVENVFGIMSRYTVSKIVMTCALLHNFLRRSKRSRLIYSPIGSFDTEKDGEIQPSSWRDDQSGVTSLLPLQNRPRRTLLSAKDIRDQFAEYFITNGAVAWQNNY